MQDDYIGEREKPGQAEGGGIRGALSRIRRPGEPLPVRWQFVSTLCILVFGIALGVFSKFLDCTASNLLPGWMQYLDITNFLGRLAVWIFLAVLISVGSRSAVRAAVNAFVFFAGMVAGYYLYSKFIAGFFPLSYAMIWVGFTVLSPFLAFACWYARGTGKAAIVISAGILSVLFSCAFAYGMFYFDVRYLPELAVLALTVLLLRRSGRETAVMAGLAVVLAVLVHAVSPYHFG